MDAYSSISVLIFSNKVQSGNAAVVIITQIAPSFDFEAILIQIIPVITRKGFFCRKGISSFVIIPYKYLTVRIVRFIIATFSFQILFFETRLSVRIIIPQDGITETGPIISLLHSKLLPGWCRIIGFFTRFLIPPEISRRGFKKIFI